MHSATQPSTDCIQLEACALDLLCMPYRLVYLNRHDVSQHCSATAASYVRLVTLLKLSTTHHVPLASLTGSCCLCITVLAVY